MIVPKIATYLPISYDVSFLDNGKLWSLHTTFFFLFKFEIAKEIALIQSYGSFINIFNNYSPSSINLNIT